MDKMNFSAKTLVCVCATILVVTMAGMVMSACNRASTPNTDINADVPAQNQAQNDTQGTAQNNTQSTTSEVISAEKAKEAALSHAGVSDDAAMRYKSERDIDNGRLVYDIEFDAAGYEYDYEVDAKTGEIVKFDKEPK